MKDKNWSGTCSARKDKRKCAWISPDLQCHLVNRGEKKSSGLRNMVYYKICKAFCSLNSVLVVGAICLVLNVTVQGEYWLSEETLGKNLHQEG